MSYRTKDEWAELHIQWQHTHIFSTQDIHVLAALNQHHAVIFEWVFRGAKVERRNPMNGMWFPVNSKCQFRPDIEYRSKQPEELNMENYSKEFWVKCLSMNPMFLSADIGSACTLLNEPINKWLDGAGLERSECKGSDVWEPVPKTHHRFMRQYKYRVASPKNFERDVVVFYRDSFTVGPVTAPAGIDTAILATPEQSGRSKYARTIPALEAKYKGFKLLAITRVVIDTENHNLTEYSTKF